MYAADNVSERSVRLLGGENSREGIVEIAYNGRWGMVCNDNFSLTDARSICEGLGFNRDDASMMSLTSARYMRLIIHHDSGVLLSWCIVCV